MYRVGIRGAGFFVPERIVTNKEISTMVETSDSWITSKVGIKQRRFIDPSQSLSDLAIKAAEAALKDASLLPEEVDLIIVASSTHDYVAGPLTSAIVKAAIGAPSAITIDLNIICAGTNYCIEIASKFIKDGTCKHAIIISGEAFTKLPNFFANRTTAVIFGDGAGALILSRIFKGKGLLWGVTHSDANGAKSLYLPFGGSKKPWSADLFLDPEAKMFMDGKAVYTFAVHAFVSMVQELTTKAQINQSDISFLFPHQANINIIQEAMTTLNIPSSKHLPIIERYGNIGGGSLIISFVEAKQKDLIKPGDLIAMLGFGSGLAWSGHLIYLSSLEDFE